MLNDALSSKHNKNNYYHDKIQIADPHCSRNRIKRFRKETVPFKRSQQHVADYGLKPIYKFTLSVFA